MNTPQRNPRWLWIAGTLAVLSLPAMYLYPRAVVPTETLEGCLRTALAAGMSSTDEEGLKQAIDFFGQSKVDVAISQANASTFQSRAVSNENTWATIATCRARFAGGEPLRPPAYQVHVAVVRRTAGGHAFPVRDARVYARAQGTFCETGRDGTCALRLLEVNERDEIELSASSEDGILGPPLKRRLDHFVTEGAELQPGESYPQLTLSVTDCKTVQALAHGRVTASFGAGQLWNPECGKTPPRRGECLAAEIRQGKAAYLYYASSEGADDADGSPLELVIEPEGRPLERVRVDTLRDVVDVTYTRDCGAAAPSIAGGAPACSIETHARIRSAAQVPDVTGQVSVRVSANGDVSVVSAPEPIRARLVGARVGPQPACVASLHLDGSAPPRALATR